MELRLLVVMLFVDGVGVDEQILWNCGCLWARSSWRGVGVNGKSCRIVIVCGHVFSVEGVGVNEQLLWNCNCLWTYCLWMGM